MGYADSKSQVKSFILKHLKQDLQSPLFCGKLFCKSLIYIAIFEKNFQIFIDTFGFISDILIEKTKTLDKET